MCGLEWPADATDGAGESSGVVGDAVGNELADGDTVTIVKGLKVSGRGRVLPSRPRHADSSPASGLS